MRNKRISALLLRIRNAISRSDRDVGMPACSCGCALAGKTSSNYSTAIACSGTRWLAILSSTHGNITHARSSTHRQDHRSHTCRPTNATFVVRSLRRNSGHHDVQQRGGRLCAAAPVPAAAPRRRLILHCLGWTRIAPRTQPEPLTLRAGHSPGQPTGKLEGPPRRLALTVTVTVRANSDISPRHSRLAGYTLRRARRAPTRRGRRGPWWPPGPGGCRQGKSVSHTE